MSREGIEHVRRGRRPKPTCLMTTRGEPNFRELEPNLQMAQECGRASEPCLTETCGGAARDLVENHLDALLSVVASSIGVFQVISTNQSISYRNLQNKVPERGIPHLGSYLIRPGLFHRIGCQTVGWYTPSDAA